MNPQKGSGRKRRSKNTFTTKSGNTIKLNRSIGERIRASRDAKARRRAVALSSLPKNRWKRMLYRLHPKRVIRYWFSRDGAIMALKLTGIAIVVGFVLLVGLFAYFRKDLPNIKDISGDKLGGSITYYDRTGQTVLWQDYDAVKRIQVKGENISDYAKNATIAIEDKDFYKHGAFDVRGILRAGINDVFNSGGGVQGGSTITQQLVKLNQNWTADRSVTRKVKEIILAVDLEREYSKQDILTGYLNIAPYGGVEYGIETAARDYFNSNAKDLTLAQASMLAAIPKSPNVYSPYSSYFDKDALVGRQHYILDQMVSQKMVTKQQAEEAKAIDVVAQVHPLQPKYQGIKAPYFVLAAKGELEKKYGSNTVKRGGWKVITTLNMDLQNVADTQVQKGLIQVRRQGGDTAAFAAEDVKTGQMVALVGGANFFSTDPNDGHEINFAQQQLPPGSSFKPYDYISLIENTTNTGAGSVLYDTQAPIPGYPCTNKNSPKTDKKANCLWDYDFNFPGPVTVRYALGGSRNVPAVKAMLTVGVNKVIATAESLGLKSGYKCYPTDETLTVAGPCYGSSAIGDGAYLHLDEHVNGFATISRLGSYIPQTYILKISDSNGKTIDQWKQPVGKQVVRADSAYIITDILSDPNASYLPASYKAHRYKGWKIGFKTGTTNDAKDGWMMSMSTQYTAGVWVGYHSRQKAMTGAMETMTEPIVKGWQYAALDSLNTTPVNWTAPSSIKTQPAYVMRSKISRLGEVIPSPSNDIYPSWYVQPKASSSSQTLDLVSNKVATSCTPELAKKSEGNSNASIFSADIYVGARSGAGSSSGNDDVHNCSDTKPSITVTPQSTTCSTTVTCQFTVTVTQGTHALAGGSYKTAPAGSVALLVNGQSVQSVNIPEGSSTWTYTFTYTPAAAGSASVGAQVVDSVLYSGSDEKSVTFGGG
ncbi:MAG TPA: transglycosylase domain-containing protein [Nevskiaceae bacterium]|nr:transglycosylase domain-containing protein [Nevskiaceae bacterium]